MNISPCKNCIKTQQRENRRDLYTPALSLFNYHTKVKYKWIYQFLINITLSISIRQIYEVLQQRPMKASSDSKMSETYLRSTDQRPCVVKIYLGASAKFLHLRI